MNARPGARNDRGRWAERPGFRARLIVGLVFAGLLAIPPTVAGQSQPQVTTGPATNLTPTSATLNGTVNPEGFTGLQCEFDWGTTPSFGNSAPCAQTLGSGTTPVPVSLHISGLSPDTTYFYQLLVTFNTVQFPGGQEQFDTPPSPVAGMNVNLGPVSGVVLAKLPGSTGFGSVGGLEQVPLGTIVDATAGVATLSAAQTSQGQIVTGQAWGGLFRITQNNVSGNWLTVLKITGPALTGCVRGAADVARSRPRHRALWMRDPGFFMTVGRFASATDHGTTKWLTEDTCKGTLIRVVHGSVRVSDFPHHRVFTLKGPHSFLAHPGRGG